MSLLDAAAGTRRRAQTLRIFTILLVLSISYIVLLHHRYSLFNPTSIFNSFRTNNAPDPVWHLSIMSPYWGFSRRAVIRATWQRLFPTVPMTTRFMIGTPDHWWMDTIAAENATHGDLIQLELKEEHRVANFIKPIIALQKLVQSGKTYRFYSKMDDDSFFDANNYFKTLLEPRLEGRLPITRSIIGRLRRARRNDVKDDKSEVSYAQGGLYTMTWDIAVALSDLQTQYNFMDMDEDVLVGRLLELGNVKWNLTKLPEPVSFEWDEKDTVSEDSCFARPDSNQNAWSHAIGSKAMHVHSLKTDKHYWKVALCFDRNGVVKDPGPNYGLADNWHETDVDEFN